MNHPEHNPDPLDELLASQPVKPKSDFAERTLARLRDEEAAVETGLDMLLAAQPVKPAADFADRVIAGLEPSEASGDDKVVGFPSWVIAVGSIAALMVLGMFSFITLFDYAREQASTGREIVQKDPARPSDTSNSSPVPEGNAPTLETSSVAYVAANDPAELDPITPAPAEVVEYETVLTLDETLGDALLLADVETLNTLQAFLN